MNYKKPKTNKMRYINNRKLNVGLPLAFSVTDYITSQDLEVCLHRKFNDDPLELNELYVTLHYDHLLKIYYSNNQNFFHFTYLIRDIIVHQYSDTVVHKDNSIIEIIRTVDDRYAFYCWRIGKSIQYTSLKI
jgi:hypothetical protein